jgi:hypothetical protein
MRRGNSNIFINAFLDLPQCVSANHCQHQVVVISSEATQAVCIVRFDVFPLDAGLLARGQYSEGPATGQLYTGFSWFPRVFKQMLSWFPRLQVATACLSCSPPDVNLVANQSHVLYMC